jgi:type IV pilus assembly protein PilC
MIGSGVSVLSALDLTAEVAGNVFYHDLWIKVREQVTAGKPIHECISGNPLLPPMLVQMINSGEDTGKLDMVLERVSTYFDAEVDTSIKTATSLIEPIMIVGMGVVVGGIGMALLLPIFSLSKPPSH